MNLTGCFQHFAVETYLVERADVTCVNLMLFDIKVDGAKHYDVIGIGSSNSPTDLVIAVKTHDTRIQSRTRGYPKKFALGYLAGAHLRFYLLVFKSGPSVECVYPS